MMNKLNNNVICCKSKYKFVIVFNIEINFISMTEFVMIIESNKKIDLINHHPNIKLC